MNRMVVSSVVGVLAAVAVAAEVAKPEQIKAKTAKTAKTYEERTGGFVVQKGTAKGCVLVVNAQKKVAKEEVVAATELVRKDARYDFVVVDDQIGLFNGVSKFPAIMKEKKAKLLIAIVDDKSGPVMLGAPEDGWAVVNVARLDQGLASDGAKKKFVPERMRKEFLRAFCYAAGGFGTQFPGNVLSVSSLKELDYCGEFLPMDTVGKIIEAQGKAGLIPERAGTYRKACMEGWAPAPTNSFQKAFWDRYMAD